MRRATIVVRTFGPAPRRPRFAIYLALSFVFFGLRLLLESGSQYIGSYRPTLRSRSGLLHGGRTRSCTERTTSSRITSGRLPGVNLAWVNSGPDRLDRVRTVDAPGRSHRFVQRCGDRAACGLGLGCVFALPTLDEELVAVARWTDTSTASRATSSVTSQDSRS